MKYDKELRDLYRVSKLISDLCCEQGENKEIKDVMINVYDARYPVAEAITELEFIRMEIAKEEKKK